MLTTHILEDNNQWRKIKEYNLLTKQISGNIELPVRVLGEKFVFFKQICNHALKYRLFPVHPNRVRKLKGQERNIKTYFESSSLLSIAIQYYTIHLDLCL